MTSPDPVPALDPSNPFASPSSLPYGLPDFARIREEHYEPAIRAGMAEHLAEVEAIAIDPQAPTVENTLIALERSGRLLQRTLAVFGNQRSAFATPGLEEIEQRLAPDLAAHHDAVAMDARLAARLHTLDVERSAGRLTLADDTAWLLDTALRDMHRAGADLEPADQDRLRDIDARLAALEAEYGRLLHAGQTAAAVLIEDVADLAGLSPDAIDAARAAAAGCGLTGYLLTMQLPTSQAPLARLERRDVRERVQRRSQTRGSLGDENDTRATVLQIVRLRAERARLLGYPHHAAWVAEDCTAGTSEAVDAMLARLAPPAVTNAVRDSRELEALLRAHRPDARLRASDWAFLAERLRRQRYAVDDAALRPYLELDRVLTHGVFRAATALYGITCTERADLAGYHPDVRVFEVHDADGSGLGLYLADHYTRASKRGGAWMTSLADRSGLLGGAPVVVNNLNIVKPPDGEPTLLAWDEVLTLFHEFGHALHALLCDVRYPSQAGTQVPRDVVEFPSQVNEMWAWEPEVLSGFAVHHRTGEPLPDGWTDALLAARRANEGFATTEYLAAALLDQAWHHLTPEQVPTDPAEVELFESAALERAGVAFGPVPPRYRSTYFQHVFAGGYDAAYYSYIWAEVLDADTVEWFHEHGGLSRDAGEGFRRTVLARGGSGDVMDAFRRLRGRAPRIEPLLARRGLGL